MARTQDGFDLNPGSLFDSMQVRLFDSMHRLTGLKVSGHIETPQLVVVGAQNSGKSSVLEALVRFHFPVDEKKPTTRFPIKLVLRKANLERTQVRIEPGKSRSEEQKEELGLLAKDLSGDTFGRIMEKAKARLGIFPSGTPGESRENLQTFCDDILVIEKHGPSLPILDLVDLPGLFDAASNTQTLLDGDMVSDLVSDYIKSPRNIILLVISAEVTDYSNLPAVGMVQRMQQEDATLKNRAICVITRADQAGEPVKTRKVLGKESPFSGYFAHPWHVVRNQDAVARKRGQTLDERDKIEAEYFGQREWEDVHSGQKGIAALRMTLKSIIWSHTKDQLPHVISEIEARIKEAETRLDSASRERATPEARRTYLGDVAERFALLTREAVKGTYENEACDKNHETGEECQDCVGFFACFGDNSLKGQQKRLRANIRALNQAFATSMRRYGKTKVEIETERATTPDPVSQQQHDDKKPHFEPQGTGEYYKHDEPMPQGRQEYEDWVRKNMDRWKSKGPGGEPSDGAYSGLLAHQAEKWDKIASQHVKAVWLVVKEFIELALEASCPDKDVLASLQHVFVNPNVKKMQLEADRSLRDLISCHDRSNPGFYDSFVEARAVREHTKALLQRLATTRAESEDSTENAGPSTISSAEQPNGQQQGSGQRHGDPKPKAAPRGSGDQKARDRNQKNREATVTYVLETATEILSVGYPFLNKALFRKSVVPMIAHQLSTAFEFNSDSGSKEKAKHAGTNAQRTVQDLYPSDFGDLAAARVIEQVEMNYEAIRASFVGYVTSLVVEQKIMGRLSNKILTMSLIRDANTEVIEHIARERPENASKRMEIEHDLNTMREVLRTAEEYLNASHLLTAASRVNA